MTHLGDVVFRHVCTHKAHIGARRGYEPTREAAVAAVANGWRRAERPVDDAQSARWKQQPGPRVGDWCETKDGSLHRIGGVRGGKIRLASPSGRFSLGSEGVTYFGIFVDHPAIPTSSLLKQPERKPGAIHQPHFTVDCRVFKE